MNHLCKQTNTCNRARYTACLPERDAPASEDCLLLYGTHIVITFITITFITITITLITTIILFTIMGVRYHVLGANILYSIGWSDNHFNNLHFILSLEAQDITTCAAEQALKFAIFSNVGCLNYSKTLT